MAPETVVRRLMTVLPLEIWSRLNRTGVNPLAPDTTSLEYRRQYGRSTAPLLPVYFDFDSSAINVNQFDSLNESGAYLVENSSPNLVIEGNCDERGTVDYNLALGELRAISVKKYLINIGVDGSRIKTISYGSERPLFPGSDEESWGRQPSSGFGAALAVRTTVVLV